jgi:DMSO/TMAO reductase YedYZ heme-binding membrane subunit
VTVLLEHPIRGHPVDTATGARRRRRPRRGGRRGGGEPGRRRRAVGGRRHHGVGSWADGLTSVGRLTGLLAADLLLVQVLLMARIPVVERAVGQDRLARWHRLAGFTSFTLMLAHIGLISWGYAAGRLAAVPATFWALTLDEPGVLLAVAGTACLVMVVVTSVRAARRRLRYESWHLLHLYAYLGVGLALPHQLWAGQDFLSSPVATAYWWTLWAAAVVAVLVWRVGLPVLRTLRHDLRVTSVACEDDTVWSIYMTGRRLDRLPVAAGQFLIWRFRSGPGWSRGHPYSLSAAPTAAACASASRRSATAAASSRPCARHARCSSRDRTGGSPHARGPARRSRSSAPASASRRCGRWPRTCPTRPATPCCCSAPPSGRCSPASSTSSPRNAACDVRWLPGTARPDSWLGATTTRPTTSPCCAAGCPTSPSATSTSAAREPGPTAVRARWPPRAARRAAARRDFGW